jgi:hypothetical protein
MEELEKKQKIELDVDLRMLNLWEDLTEVAAEKGWSAGTVKVIAIYMRAGYGAGYFQALEEKPEDRGKLARDHGFRVPNPSS